MPPQKVLTKDGSATLYSNRYRQHYHNISGALTESHHVFFERTGLTDALSKHHPITICETGFGTGLHLLMLESLRIALHSQSAIRYFSVEKSPVAIDLIREIDFPGQMALLYSKQTGGFLEEPTDFEPVLTAFFQLSRMLHSARTGNSISLTMPEFHGSQTEATIFRGDFFDWNLDYLIRSVDFFLHDAFSPAANPELWTSDTFSKLLTAAKPNAVLGTYCSATRARAAMIIAGWKVGRTAGPPGKREMTLASPSEEPLNGYKRVNEERLRDRFSGEKDL